jgi:hypothetical protein
VWPIIRDALQSASPRIRRLIRTVAIFWLLMLALQVWDSRNAEGAAGVAEFLSVLLGITGVGLLGLAHTLHLSMEEAAARTRTARDQPAVARVLLALPAVGFAAGVAVGGATLLMIVRAVLGAEVPFAVLGALLYGGLTAVAARPVMLSSRALFTFATQQADAAATLRTAATAARLDALQARMNPHMLFNALNTVAALVRANPPAAERVPPFVVQPLVENALRHGLGGRLDGGHIEIAIVRDGLALVATVKDDGAGFRTGWTEGVGLGNLRQRLKAQYGDGASLTIESAPGASRVTVSISEAPEP